MKAKKSQNSYLHYAAYLAYLAGKPFADRFTRNIIIASFGVSLVSFLYFYGNQMQNLADYDAIARLNIACKMLDSMTPGIGQPGGIWLPFPQILMLPFVWSDTLWHTGIAGAIVSMTAFMLAAIFLYQTVVTLTGNKFAGLITWLVFVTNINMLFLQTMAMSESFFLFTVIMVIYFLTKWTKTERFIDLLGAAIFVTLVTLTRYEGYTIYLGAAATVIASSLILFKHRRRAKAEGMLVVFMTLASFGIGLWSYYSATIYGDPLYWLHLYTGTKSIVPVTDVVATGSAVTTTVLYNAERATGLDNAIKTYGTAMTYMNGVLISAVALSSMVGLAIFGVIVSAKLFIKRHITIGQWLDLAVPYFPIIIMTGLMALFLIFGYQKGIIPTIGTPALNWQTFMSKANNIASSSNIRYGIIVLPFFAIFFGLLAARSRTLLGFAALVIAAQVFFALTTPYFLLFQMPAKYTYSVPPYAVWFKDHYDSGQILVSANRFEPFMFQTGLPYDHFIYEGTRKHWFDSLANPTDHAKWVVYDETVLGDAVHENMQDLAVLDRNYDLVYRENGLHIYRRKAIYN